MIIKHITRTRLGAGFTGGTGVGSFSTARFFRFEPCATFFAGLSGELGAGSSGCGQGCEEGPAVEDPPV